jgi:hypothetical protein
VDDFISQTIKNDTIPDLLIETMEELRREQNQYDSMMMPRLDYDTGNSSRLPSDRYVRDVVGFENMPPAAFTTPYESDRLVLGLTLNLKKINLISDI